MTWGRGRGRGRGSGSGSGRGRSGICLELEPEPEFSKMGVSGNPDFKTFSHVFPTSSVLSVVCVCAGCEEGLPEGDGLHGAAQQDGQPAHAQGEHKHQHAPLSKYITGIFGSGSRNLAPVGIRIRALLHDYINNFVNQTNHIFCQNFSLIWIRIRNRNTDPDHKKGC